MKIFIKITVNSGINNDQKATNTTHTHLVLKCTFQNKVNVLIFNPLFILPYKMVLIFQSVNERYHPKLNTTEQYFPVVLFIMLYKVVLTFESVGEILRCHNSNESY